MAITDPRTKLKSFTVKQCGSKAGNDDTNLRKDFFNQIGKIGDIEGLGKVGGGLRTLTKLSNSVRVGEGALPSFIGSSVDKGANFVLDAVGIAPGAIEALRPFNPGVVNRGVGQAKAIWSDVKDGTYNLSDIPDTFSDLQNLERLARGIFTPKAEKETGAAVCEASPWAMDLDPFFPKYKFLFLVQFELNEPYNIIKNGNQPNMFEFVVKSTTRPNINFEYEEVNMYNFRTQVAKRTQNELMTMRFYDDNINRIMQFYSIYLKAMSPISNMAFKQKAEGTDWYEQSGMDFDAPKTSPVAGISTNVYSGSLGALEPNSLGEIPKTLISRINLFHVYSMGRKYNKYIFFNPRIQTMELDDLDMAESGTGNEISLQFNYDSMFLAPGVTVTENSILTSLNLASGAQHPFKYEVADGKFIPPEPEPGGAYPGEQVEDTAAVAPIPTPLKTTKVSSVAPSTPKPDGSQTPGAGATSETISKLQPSGSEKPWYSVTDAPDVVYDPNFNGGAPVTRTQLEQLDEEGQRQLLNAQSSNTRASFKIKSAATQAKIDKIYTDAGVTPPPPVETALELLARKEREGEL